VKQSNWFFLPISCFLFLSLSWLSITTWNEQLEQTHTQKIVDAVTRKAVVTGTKLPQILWSSIDTFSSSSWNAIKTVWRMQEILGTWGGFKSSSRLKFQWKDLNSQSQTTCLSTTTPSMAEEQRDSTLRKVRNSLYYSWFKSDFSSSINID
jgi:hypothetical protein